MDSLPGKKYTMSTPKMVSHLQPGPVKVDLEDLHGHMVLLFGSSKCPLMKGLLGDHGHSFQEVAGGLSLAAPATANLNPDNATHWLCKCRQIPQALQKPVSMSLKWYKPRLPLDE